MQRQFCTRIVLGILRRLKELHQKQTAQRSRGRKANAMDSYFYQTVKRVLQEELAVAFHESQKKADKRLVAAVS